MITHHISYNRKFPFNISFPIGTKKYNFNDDYIAKRNIEFEKEKEIAKNPEYHCSFYHRWSMIDAMIYRSFECLQYDQVFAGSPVILQINKTLSNGTNILHGHLISIMQVAHSYDDYVFTFVPDLETDEFCKENGFYNHKRFIVKNSSRFELLRGEEMLNKHMIDMYIHPHFYRKDGTRKDNHEISTDMLNYDEDTVKYQDINYLKIICSKFN